MELFLKACNELLHVTVPFPCEQLFGLRSMGHCRNSLINIEGRFLNSCILVLAVLWGVDDVLKGEGCLWWEGEGSEVP